MDFECSSTSLYEDRCGAISDLLISAIMAGDVSEVQTLVSGGACIAPSHQWAIYYGCLHGCTMIKALASSIDLNRPISDEEGQTVLHELLRTPAKQFSDTKAETINLLLNLGASAVAPNSLGDTPLHSSVGDEAMLGSFPVLQVLLGNNDDGVPFIPDLGEWIDKKNSDPYRTTPLIIATLYNNLDCVRLLLQSGANPDERGEEIEGQRRPALYFAAERNYLDIFKVLVEFGAEVDSGTAEILSPSMIQITEQVKIA